MIKHTPGPWRASPYSSIVGIAITAPSAHIAGVRGDVEIATANAKLIAAAPDLAMALHQIAIGAGESSDGLSYSEIADIATAALIEAGL